MKKILLIVDPQNDFITGSLAVEGAEEKMMKLAEYIEDEGYKYDYVYITMDTHPENHCSFKENGGIWPKHCVANTKGWALPEYINNDILDIYVYVKGTETNREEYSIFDNSNHGNDLENDIITLMHNCGVSIDICGIAGDYCVLETLKGLRRIVGDSYITILTQYTASIDGGEKLMNYIKENNLNYE